MSTKVEIKVETGEKTYDPDYPIDHVPLSARKSLLSTAIVLLGFTFFSGTMLAGATLGSAYPFSNLLLVLLIGNILLGTYVATLSGISAKVGLTTVLLTRYTLGSYGAKWADLLLGGTQVGWFGVTVAFVAIPFATILNLPASAIPILMIIWGILHGLTAYFGYQGMEKLSIVSVPLLLIIGLWSVNTALKDIGGFSEILAIQPVETITFGTALTMIVGTFVSGGTQAPNWGRFAKTPKIAALAGFIAFFIGNAVMLLFGAFGGAVYGESDMAVVLSIQGLLVFGVIFLTLNIWTTNDNAAYAFGVAGAEAFNLDNKRLFVVIGSAAGIILAITGIYDFLPRWLIAMGTFIPPLGGVIIADFLFIWKRKLPKMEHVQFARVRWSGILAYVLGCLSALYIPGIPPINGIIGAAIAMVILQPIFARLKGCDHSVNDNAEYV